MGDCSIYQNSCHLPSFCKEILQKLVPFFCLIHFFTGTFTILFLVGKARHPMKKEIFAMVGLGGRPVRVNSPGLSDANKCRSASRHSCESVVAKLGSLGSLTSKQPWLRQADATSSVRGRSGLPARTGLPNAPSSSRFITFRIDPSPSALDWEARALGE